MVEPITYRNLAELRPSLNNYRQGDVGAIVTSILAFGFNSALRVWQGGVVKAGNHSLLALQSIKASGLPIPTHIRVQGDSWLVPCIDISHLSETQANAFMIADNRLTEIAENDDTRLAALLAGIASEDASLLNATGYDSDDLDAILSQLATDALQGVEAPEAQVDRADELQKVWNTARGQLWVIPSKTGKGEHRLLCGDSTNAEDVARVLCHEPVDIMHADPPYGIDLLKQRGNLGKSKAYNPIIGDNKPFDPTPFLNIATHSLFWGANHFANMLPASPFWLVWDKQGGAKDTTFATCEMAWCSDKQPARVITHVWDGFRRDSEQGIERDHPNQKPVAVIQWALTWLKGNTVFEPYVGSGTTLVACETTARLGRGIEIDARYVAVALQRLADMGLTPRLSDL